MSMDEKPNVAVLMSTYNGEKYIKEQLDSIFAQVNVNVLLFVRDDGSNDNTVSIIEEYSNRYPIEILYDNVNVGPGESFMRLIYKYANLSKVDYYAFADQDDIWLTDKLYRAIIKIQEIVEDKPILYASNQYLYINEINHGLRYQEPQDMSLISHMTRNTVSGCTYVMNKQLINLVANAKRPDARIISCRLHDAWVMLVAIVCGKVIYDHDSYMLYRIHDQNVVGIKKIRNIDKLRHMLKMVYKRNGKNIRMLTAQELLRLFCIHDEEDRYILSLYANYRSSMKTRIMLLSNHHIIMNCLESPFLFRIKVLLGFV